MRIAVFGASGRAGRHVVEEALRSGHEVTALARNPATLPPRPGLAVVGGDVRDPVAVAATVHDSQAIISTLGRRRRGPAICTAGIRTILATIATGGPRRLVVLSNYGVAESRRREPYVAVSWLLQRAVLRDKEHMEALLRDSGAEWTVVRAPVLTDRPATRAYRAGADLRLSFTSTASRADLADLMVRRAADRAHLRGAVAIRS